MRHLLCWALLTLLPVLAAQTKGAKPHLKPLSPAFFGAWKENPAKGREPDVTATFTRKADGIHLGDAAHAFQYDGVDRPSAGVGVTTAWKKTGARSYVAVMKRAGKPLNTTTRAISADGNTMTVTLEMAETGSRTITEWKRLGTSADSDPLLGTWKLNAAGRLSRTPGRMTIEKAGEAIRLTNGIPGKAVPEFVAKLDGADSLWQGKKGVATVSLKQLDDHAFVEFLKLKGTPFTLQEFVLSADGKTIAKTTTIVGQSARTSVMVYEKQ